MQLHTTRHGDDLSSIAAKYDTTVDDILNYNKHLSNATTLPAGSKVIIPVEAVEFDTDSVSASNPHPKIKKVNPQPDKVPSTPKGPKIEAAESDKQIKNTHPDLVKNDSKPINEISQKIDNREQANPLESEVTQNKTTNQKTQEDCLPCKAKCQIKIGCQHNLRIYEKKPPYYAIVPGNKEKDQNKDGHYCDKINIWLKGSYVPKAIYLDKEIIKKKGADHGGSHFQKEVPYTQSFSIASFESLNLIGLSKMINPPIENYLLYGDCLGAIPIKVHSPDVWELKIGFPAWKSVETGRKSFGSVRPSEADEYEVYRNRRSGTRSTTVSRTRQRAPDGEETNNTQPTTVSGGNQQSQTATGSNEANSTSSTTASSITNTSPNTGGSNTQTDSSTSTTSSSTANTANQQIQTATDSSDTVVQSTSPTTSSSTTTTPSTDEQSQQTQTSSSSSSSHELEANVATDSSANTGTQSHQTTTTDTSSPPSSSSSEGAGESISREVKYNFPPGVELKCNNQTVTLNSLHNLYQVIVAAKNILNIVGYVQSVILSIKPKWGVYVKMSLGFMEGGIHAKWHEKEHQKDHRVYTYFEFGISLKFIKIELEVGIGASISDDVGIQLYLKATGEVSATDLIVFDEPDLNYKKVKKDILFKGAVEFSIGFRAQAKEYFKVEGCFSSGFEIPINAILAPGNDPFFHIKGKLIWTGVKGKLEVSISTGKDSGLLKFDFEEDFIPPKDIAEFNWPDKPQEYNPSFTPSQEIKKIFEEQLTDWWNIKVGKKYIKEDVWLGFNSIKFTEITTKDIVDALVEPIINHPYMLTDKQTIKLIAQKVNEDLDKMGERDWERDY
ncbi:LysM peptidoglycan-binding domain-containing protein, partial [Endozoicomonas sp. SM1973]